MMFPEFKPDIVILDMRMPMMSGADACAIIRQTSDVPVIMFTSLNDAREVRDAIMKGATDFVLKSTGISELTERISFHLKQRKPINYRPAGPKSATPAAAPKRTPANPQEPIKSTTLIIDPDEANRAVIAAILNRLDQNVIEVNTAADAIEAYKQHKPDIIFTSWSLPDMDAFNMLAEFKERKGSKKVFKIMMSPRLAPEAQRKAEFSGITEFLHKPLDAAKVDMLIAICVRKSIRNLRTRIQKAA
jgi:CheY-like chemotaxis protein